jgi:hypothetical protein
MLGDEPLDTVAPTARARRTRPSVTERTSARVTASGGMLTHWQIYELSPTLILANCNGTKGRRKMLGKLVAVAGLCFAAVLANAAPRAPRTLLIDACGQMRDNALRIWSDQTIVSIRENPEKTVIYCFVGGADRNMKTTFAVRPPGGSDLNDAGREALMAACNQMKRNPNNVFGGRKVYFTEDPDIRVVYCLVRRPDPTDMSEVGVTDPRFVDTVEMLFMSYYGEPLGEDM